MRGKPGQDYLADFATIGAEPGCSPSELEAAWRRRVSDLHPDRSRPDGAEDAVDRRHSLSEINGAYRRLRHFQRRHGRMPGAARPPAGNWHADLDRESEHRSWATPTGRTWLLALFNASLLALLAILVWILLERAGIRDHGGPGRGAEAIECAAPGGTAHPPCPHLAPLRNSTTSTV